VSEDVSRRIRTVSLMLAVSALLSRVLGYGRDWLINFEFGATGQTDVYRASFTVPDMLNYLLAGGALSVSLLPRMSALYSAEKDAPAGAERESDRVFSLVATNMAVLTAVLVLLAELATEPLVARWTDGFTPAKVAETAHLTRIVLPAQWFFICGGLVQATLLARQSFRAMALTPLLYNLGIIVGGLIGGRLGQIEGFSWGALVGAILGGFVVPVWAARGQLRFRPRFAPTHPEMRAFLVTALPLMLGVGLTTVDEWLGKRYGSRLGDGAISRLDTARKLMLVPIGLIGGAAGQATGAWLAKLWAEQRVDEFRQTLGDALATVIGLSLAVSALLAAAAEPVVSSLFAYGKFQHADAVLAAGALQVMALGIAAWSAHQVLSRAFFALGDTWRPMVATTLVTAAMVPAYGLLTDWGGLRGLGVAGSVGMVLQVLALLGLARVRLQLPLRPLLGATARSIVVAALAGGAAWAATATLQGVWSGQRGAWLQALAAGVAWLAVVLVVGGWLGLPGLQTLTHKIRRRLKMT
jgi:putative peptidoglycan lipid II flippase